MAQCLPRLSTFVNRHQSLLKVPTRQRTVHTASESTATLPGARRASEGQAIKKFRLFSTALRACSPVVVDVPVETRQFLLLRYLEVSIRNARLGLVSGALLLFGLAYEAPLVPRLVAIGVLSAGLLLRVMLAEKLTERLDVQDPRSGVLHDILLLIFSSAWSVAPFFLQHAVSQPNLFGIVYGALVALAVMSASYSAALPIGISVVTLNAAPLVLFMALQGTVVFGVLAFATTVCVASLVGRMRGNHLTLLASLAAQQANARLVDKLEEYRLRLEVENASLGDSLRDASREANRDLLTGLYNRRHLAQFAAPLAERVAEQVEMVVVCVIDVDHFKRVNDEHGHLVGDEVLKAVSMVLQARLREGDCAVRFGGEEFVVVLRACDLTRGRRVAEALRQSIEQAGILGQTLTRTLTASIGISQWYAGDRLDDVIRRADDALYSAKRSGRNRVVASGEVPQGRPNSPPDAPVSTHVH